MWFCCGRSFHKTKVLDGESEGERPMSRSTETRRPLVTSSDSERKRRRWQWTRRRAWHCHRPCRQRVCDGTYLFTQLSDGQRPASKTGWQRHPRCLCRQGRAPAERGRTGNWSDLAPGRHWRRSGSVVVGARDRRTNRHVIENGERAKPNETMQGSNHIRGPGVLPDERRMLGTNTARTEAI